MKLTRKARRAARRLYRVCVVGGLLDQDRARQAARRVAEARRRWSLPLLAQFQSLVRLDRVEHEAIVESATPLAADQRSNVESRVARTYGPGMTTEFADNPALIAGMRVKVGSDLYDGSVRRALLTLAERF